MIGLQKLLTVLPALFIGLISSSGSSAGYEEFGSQSGKALRFGSWIPEHETTMWNGIAESFHQFTDREVLFTDVLQYHDKSISDNDIVEMPLYDAIDACDKGELNLLPLPVLMSGSVGIDEVFWNAVQPCSVGHSIWATVVAFNSFNRDGIVEPTIIQDFFDTTTFPGKRALKKTPRAIVEWSLLNNGVPSNLIYSALSVDSSWSEVEAMLLQLAPDIVWVETDSEALKMLQNGSVAFAAVSSQNLVRRVAQNEEKFGVIWQGAIAHMSMLGIPKNAAAEESIRLLKFITDAGRNLQMSTALGYAPVRIDQLPLIKESYHHVLPSKEQATDLIWHNSKWWREESQELESRFLEFVGELRSS